MITISELKPKDSKIERIRSFKAFFGLGLYESKLVVEELDSMGYIRFDDDWRVQTAKFKTSSVKSICVWILKNYDGHYSETKTISEYTSRIPVIDAETQEAIDWYNQQDDYVKNRVDLVGKWMNPTIIASAG